jgi:3-methyladenine DNA glycosylase AlkD
MAAPADLVDDLRERLRAHADPARARAQQAYMKSAIPFLGVARPDQRRVFRAFVRDHPPADRAAWAAGADALWAGAERELRYAAIGWVTGFRGRFLDLEAVPRLERMVREGAWWDLVDDLAANGVGPVVLGHREPMRPVLARWIEDPDVWLRRTAILAQLKHKAQTDAAQLFDLCARQAGERSFWIRKAIGWALREHAKTDPDAVRTFLAAQGDRLSGLSRREAGKHLAG